MISDGVYVNTNSYIWKRKYTLIPKKCHISNKLIWFTYGYMVHTRNLRMKKRQIWRNEKIHMIELIKGNNNPYSHSYHEIIK